MDLFIMSLSLMLLVTLAMCAHDYKKRKTGDTLTFQPERLHKDQIVNGRPSFCKKLDCPLFKVIENKDLYQLREYEAILWVQTTSEHLQYKKAGYENFMRLFKYISGANVQKRKIAMTVPVMDKITPGQGPTCKSNFTMSFFLTQNVSLFDTFPSPTNNNVSLARTPKLRAFVRSFPGYVTSYDTYREEAQKMIDAINNSTRYIVDYFYTAGYNSPFELFRRHNEVWLIANENLQD